MTPATSIRAVFIAVLAVAAWTVPYNAASAGASNLAAEPQIPGVSLVGDNAHTRSETFSKSASRSS